MQKRVCIINLSAPEIQLTVLTNRQFETVNLNLPWEVGFRQEVDGTLTACFGEAFDRLDSNQSAEIRFTDLDLYFKEITDAETLECLFHAFFEEIFQRRFPDHGHPAEAVSVYLITPYQWKSVHRQQLRSAIKDSRTAGLAPLNVTLRSILSQVLCLAIYYQETWTDILANVSNLHLFLVDFTRRDLMLYQLVCKRLSGDTTVELLNILRFPDFFIDMEKQASNLQHTLQTVGETDTVAVGFSGVIDHSSRAIIELLQARCSAIFLEPQETATLLGGTKLVQQFETKGFTKLLHLKYQFCFGVQLPDGQWIELIPKTWTPPYQRKKAFRVTGTLEKFDLNLFCGLSLTDHSDVHYLATLEIDPAEDSNSASLNSPEFILSVALDDSTHGTFAVHLPNPHKTKSVEFTVPVLMD